jgi:Methane oxygenase PmoA
MSSRGSRILAAMAGLTFLVATAATAARAQTMHLSGRGGDADWGETPVVVEVKAPIADGAYVLDDGRGGAAIPAAVFLDGDRRWLGAILPAVPAGKPFSYALKPRPASSADRGGIGFTIKGSEMEVTIDDRPLSNYRLSPGSKPFLHPIIGPTGEPFTRAYPMADIPGEDRDHPHQRACWFTHGSVNGVDFWSEGAGKGKIQEVKREIVQTPILGRLRTLNAWLAPDGRRVCEDRRTMTFYGTKVHRTIDFEIVIEATDGPVTFGDTKEGMFGLRVASSMDVTRKKGGKITNAEGMTDERAWGQASPWVDYVGPVKEQTVGIAVLNHPGSFRYPTTWHVRTYGLFAANPFGWKDFGKPERGDYTLPAGESIRFAYRVILHKGDTASLGVPAMFQAYAGKAALEVRAD